jgi:hypothetical protein
MHSRDCFRVAFPLVAFAKANKLNDEHSTQDGEDPDLHCGAHGAVESYADHEGPW